MQNAQSKKKYEGHRARLRKRAFRHIQGIDDYEVLEVLLTYIQPRKDVKPQAKEILEYAGSIDAMVKLDAKAYDMIHGVGEKISNFCTVLVEVAKRYAKANTPLSTIIQKTTDADDNIIPEEDVEIILDGSLEKYEKYSIAGFAKEYVNTTNEYITMQLHTFTDVRIYLESSVFFTNTAGKYIIYLGEDREILFTEEYDFGEENKDFLSHLISIKSAGVIFVNKIAKDRYVLSKKEITLLRKRDKALLLFGIELLDYILCTPRKMISLQQFSMLPR